MDKPDLNQENDDAKNDSKNENAQIYRDLGLFTLTLTDLLSPVLVLCGLSYGIEVKLLDHPEWSVPWILGSLLIGFILGTRQLLRRVRKK